MRGEGTRSRRGDIAGSKRLLGTKVPLFGNKSSIYELQCESLLQELGIPRWRHDDLTSNVFGSDARVDTLACRVGIVASRSSGG
jgi:hypothetical protein